MLPLLPRNGFLTLFLLFFAPLHLLRAQLEFDLLGKLYPDDFFQAPRVSQHSLSPSGSKYLYAYSSDKSNYVYVVDVESGDKTRYVGLDASEDYITFLAWKNDEQVLFQTQYGNIFHLDLKTGLRTLIFDAERVALFYNAIFWGNFSLPRIVSLLPDDPKHVLISAYDKNAKRVVYKIPVDQKSSDSPEVYIKSSRGINSWHADLRGDIRLGVKSDQNGRESSSKFRNWAS